MTEPPVLLERRNAVAVVTLNRPDRMNALSRQTLLELGRIGRELVADRDVRAIVIAGSGDRAFCAGADLKERRTMNEVQIREQLHLYRTELGWIDPSPVPVAAAINGVALGGGLEIALMCDLRIASQSAVLGLPETLLGIIPGAGGTQRLPRIVGEAKAKELILLARRLTAPEALACGLIHRVTPRGTKVLDDTLEFIRPISEGAPVAQSAALRAIDAAATKSLTEGLDRELELYDECLHTEDRLEALQAFTEKRPPRFKGR